MLDMPRIREAASRARYTINPSDEELPAPTGKKSMDRATMLHTNLLNNIVREIQHQVQGQMQLAGLKKETKIDGDKVKREVMAMLLRAMQSDPSIAEAMGNPIDNKTIDGLIAACVRMSGMQLSKAFVWDGNPKQMLG